MTRYKKLMLLSARFARRAARCWTGYRRTLDARAFQSALYWHGMAQKMRDAALSIPLSEAGA